MTSTGVIYEQMYPFTASAGADLLFRSETEKTHGRHGKGKNADYSTATNTRQNQASGFP